MTATVAGVLKDGQLVLDEKPAGLRDGRVRVVLIQDERDAAPSQPIRFGMFPGGPDTTPEDFREAEFHGEAEFEGGDAI